MKYHESTCNEYIQASKQFNLHPELSNLTKSMPASLSSLGNMIFYGPSGAGKYTQFLRFIEPYSEHRLKTEKMTVQTEKQIYEYRISDVHYEIDMALLGCESKKLWNDSFFQIVDVVSAKKSKAGIICCKNFHSIHSELLDVFYSYMQHCRTLSIHIVFVLLTEHVSFIPKRVLQCCKIIPVKRPDATFYEELSNYHLKYETSNPTLLEKKTHKGFTNNVGLVSRMFPVNNATQKRDEAKDTDAKPDLDPESILNLKEMRAYKRHHESMPKDVFNIVCDNIINEMTKHQEMRLLELRDHLYDILLYGLDVTECLWYILFCFVERGELTGSEDLSEVLTKINLFLKYYNNNYRPIYHLESIFIYLITKIYKYPPLTNEP